MLEYTKQLTKARHTPEGQHRGSGQGWALIRPAPGELLGGAGGQLNDDVVFSLLGQSTEQRKDLAVEWMVRGCHLKELTLWVMPVCSLLVRVPSAMNEDRW